MERTQDEGNPLLRGRSLRNRNEGLDRRPAIDRGQSNLAHAQRHGAVVVARDDLGGNPLRRAIDLERMDAPLGNLGGLVLGVGIHDLNRDQPALGAFLVGQTTDAEPEGVGQRGLAGRLIDSHLGLETFEDGQRLIERLTIEVLHGLVTVGLEHHVEVAPNVLVAGIIDDLQFLFGRETLIAAGEVRHVRRGVDGDGAILTDADVAARDRPPVAILVLDGEHAIGDRRRQGRAGGDGKGDRATVRVRQHDGTGQFAVLTRAIERGQIARRVVGEVERAIARDGDGVARADVARQLDDGILAHDDGGQGRVVALKGDVALDHHIGDAVGDGQGDGDAVRRAGAVDDDNAFGRRLNLVAVLAIGPLILEPIGRALVQRREGGQSHHEVAVLV